MKYLLRIFGILLGVYVVINYATVIMIANGAHGKVDPFWHAPIYIFRWFFT